MVLVVVYNFLMSLKIVLDIGHGVHDFRNYPNYVSFQYLNPNQFIDGRLVFCERNFVKFFVACDTANLHGQEPFFSLRGPAMTIPQRAQKARVISKSTSSRS